MPIYKLPIGTGPGDVNNCRVTECPVLVVKRTAVNGGNVGAI